MCDTMGEITLTHEPSLKKTPSKHTTTKQCPQLSFFFIVYGPTLLLTKTAVNEQLCKWRKLSIRVISLQYINTETATKAMVTQK